MFKNIGISSEIYHIEIDDINCLPLLNTDYSIKDTQSIHILIGDNSDSIIFGGHLLEKAKQEQLSHVPVRVMFKLKYPIWKIHYTLIKKLRDKFRINCYNIYHIKPSNIRDLNIERGYRYKENSHMHSNAIYKYEDNKLYNDLSKSIIRDGYNDNFPMDIQLCRRFGVQDCLNQGHHRMGILIDNNIARASIKFSAVGYIGTPFKLVLLKLARKSLAKKRLKSKI